VQRLKWFLVGTALTAFTADYLNLKAHHRESEALATKAAATADRFQTVNTACLVELAYNKSLIDSWSEKSRIITMARSETLVTIDKAKEGDAEAILALKDLGYTISQKRITAMRYGIGGP